MKLAVRIEPNPESRRVRHRQAPVYRDGLIQQERRKHGNHLVGLRRHHQKFREGTVVARDDVVIAINAGTVRHYQDAAFVGKC
jgi:hypothetical protein